jgi:hypothetical protein
MKNKDRSITMKLFKDLEFNEHPMGGVMAKMVFSNGFTISVIAGEGPYSTPREALSDPNEFSAFEVAIFDDKGDFATQHFFPDETDDVMGWQGRDDINTLMLLVQSRGM